MQHSHCWAQPSAGPKALGLAGVANRRLQGTDYRNQKNDQEMAHLGRLGRSSVN